MKLVGKTALITGSCSEGMGRSIALCLAREGANIVLNYGTHRHGDDVQAQAERIAETIKELGSKAIIQPANTTNEQRTTTTQQEKEEAARRACRSSLLNICQSIPSMMRHGLSTKQDKIIYCMRKSKLKIQRYIK